MTATPIYDALRVELPLPEAEDAQSTTALRRAISELARLGTIIAPSGSRVQVQHSNGGPYGTGSQFDGRAGAPQPRAQDDEQNRHVFRAPHAVSAA